MKNQIILLLIFTMFLLLSCDDNGFNSVYEDRSAEINQGTEYNGEGERTPYSGRNPYINRHYNKAHPSLPCKPPRYRCLDDVIVVAKKQGVVANLDNHISNGTVDQFFSSSSYHDLYEDMDLVDNPAYLALVNGEATLEKHIVGSNTFTSNTICYNVVPANSSITLSDWDWYYSSTSTTF